MVRKNGRTMVIVVDEQGVVLTPTEIKELKANK